MDILNNARKERCGKTNYNDENRYYDLYIPEEKPKDEHPPDLITVHINRDQLVCLTEDLLVWIFRKIKGAFKRKKKTKKVRDE